MPVEDWGRLEIYLKAGNVLTVRASYTHLKRDASALYTLMASAFGHLPARHGHNDPYQVAGYIKTTEPDGLLVRTVVNVLPAELAAVVLLEDPQHIHAEPMPASEAGHTGTGGVS